MISIHHCVRISVLALSILALPSCNEEQEQINRLQNEIRSLTDQQTLGQSELNRVKAQVSSMVKEKDSLKEEKAKLEAELESARKTHEQLQKDFASYRSQYKVSMRTRGPGMNLGELVVDGKTYLNVVVKEVTEELLMVIHNTGPMRIPWASLPVNVRRLFGIETPGEFQEVSFNTNAGNGAPPSTAPVEEKIKWHDEQMRILEQEIRTHEAELEQIRKARAETYSVLAQAHAKKLDTAALSRSVNAFDMKTTKLNADILGLKKKQKNLLENNPRRKRT